MKRIIIILLGFLFAIGCTHYKRQVPSFKMPEGYSNVQEVSMAKIGAYSYKDSAEAKKAFGFDIVRVGLLPIQVVFDNKGSHTLEINPSQTFLIDKDKNVWPILDSELAYERLIEKTEMAEVASGTVKPGILGAAAGTVLGAAVGVITGENVAEYAGKGAAVGAAVGITYGGSKEVTTKTAEEKIAEDLQNKKLQNKKINPKEISHGFIFFPGEAKSVKELRLQLKEVETGITHTINFPL
jgi:hypothetical protein